MFNLVIKTTTKKTTLIFYMITHRNKLLLLFNLITLYNNAYHFKYKL